MAQGESPIVTDNDLRLLWQHWHHFDTPTEKPAKPYNRDRRECTHVEISRELGITPQAVQQIEQRALKKLRTIINERGWEAGMLALLG